MNGVIPLLRMKVFQRIFQLEFQIPLFSFLPAYIIALVLSIILGLIAGARKGKLADKIIDGLSSFGIAIPSFWMAMILRLYFWISVSIFFQFSGCTQLGTKVRFLDLLSHLVLPMYRFNALIHARACPLCSFIDDWAAF